MTLTQTANTESETIAKLNAAGPPPWEIDLVVGWVAPVGVEIKPYIDHLCNYLKQSDFGFEVNPIPVIDLIKEQIALDDFQHFDSNDYYEKIVSRQDAGDDLRRTSHPGILSGFVIKRIADYRESSESNRRLHMVKSLKHPEEALALRRVYGDNFLLIGAYSSYKSRLDFLKNKCSDSDDKARDLIERDEDGKTHHGQNTRDLFPLCDCFIEHIPGEPDESNNLLSRFIELVFGAINIVPSKEEYGMVTAFRSSEQASDLARQVGAALFSSSQELLTTGRNDVPKPGGGVYRAKEEFDRSDMMLGHDYGQKGRQELIEAAVRAIVESNDCLSKERNEAKSELKKRFSDEIRLSLTESQLRDIVEYGRAVHAEMDVITTCARLGLSTKDGSLYVTTFPCHNCARHIIAAGITKVVYLEPYKKSKALELHADSIDSNAMRQDGLQLENGESISADESVTRVKFVPFVGVSPRRYSDLFSLRTQQGAEIKRKNSLGIRLDRMPKYEWLSFEEQYYASQVQKEAPESDHRQLRNMYASEGLYLRERRVFAYLMSFVDNSSQGGISNGS